jgi:hypothetical protein
VADNDKVKKGRLRAQRVFDVPLKEVSGICSRRGSNRQMSLVAVGDRSAHLAWISLPYNKRNRWHIEDIARFTGSKVPARDSQIEAVCADAEGRVLLLQEEPPRAELVNLRTSRVVASIDLVVEHRDELGSSWSSINGSRGEGVVLLSGGHLLIAKEKHPAALIEFGPRGSRSHGLMRGGSLRVGARWARANGTQTFVACAVWVPDKVLRKICADFSDLEVGPDGRLYLLSDKSATIARIDDLAPGGGIAKLTAAWRLNDLGGKPEGLAFTAGGCAIVALDKRKSRRNLAVLAPAIASRHGGAKAKKNAR